MAVKNPFINGMTELLVLYFLKQKDCYVYEMTKAVSELSEGRLSIPQNTIYTVTYKLENEGIITEYSKLVGRKRTRVYYHLEAPGEAYLEELMTAYRATYTGVELILQKTIAPCSPDAMSGAAQDENT